MRREKQELEAKTAGVDLKKIEKEEELLRSVKAEMEKMKEEASENKYRIEYFWLRFQVI